MSAYRIPSRYRFAVDVLEEVARLVAQPPLIEVSRGIWLRADRRAAFKAAQEGMSK